MNSNRNEIHAGLRKAGLRPTQQRVALASLLFNDAHHHFTPEDLYLRAMAAGIRISLATVYNCCHQFADVGMIKALPVSGPTSYFDTNIADHHHFNVEGEDELIDISWRCSVDRLPPIPDDMTVSGVDIIIRLRAAKSL